MTETVIIQGREMLASVIICGNLVEPKDGRCLIYWETELGPYEITIHEWPEPQEERFHWHLKDDRQSWPHAVKDEWHITLEGSIEAVEAALVENFNAIYRRLGSQLFDVESWIDQLVEHRGEP